MFLRIGLTAAMTAMILAACGGGGGGGSSGSASDSETQTTSVKVVGDSLNDSGTFGFKFTVQGTPTYPIWTDRVATAVAAPALCARYSAPGGVPALNPAATACTSYGVGGGRINPRGVPADTTPVSIVQQLKDVRASGPYNPEELLLVDGGGNDIADLVGDYFYVTFDGGAAFAGLTGELIEPGQAGLPFLQKGNVYMVKLANLLAETVTSEALDRGAQRVVVLTAPDVTRTPRFLALLAAVEALVNAGGGNGAVAAAELKGAANLWITAFNNQLKARFAGHSRVVVVDFYAEFNKWLDTPATYGLTNTTTPACPATGIDAQGLPTYSIATCTDVSLSATPPTGGWWATYVFSDNFHGTPRTNELMGELVVKALEAKGWK